jgi:hypothetical protein
MAPRTTSRIQPSVIRRTLSITPSQLEATKSRTSVVSSALGAGTSLDAVIRALRSYLEGPPTSAPALQKLLRRCDEFLADAGTDTSGRKGHRVVLVEDLRAEVMRELGVLAAQWEYVEAAHAEPDPDEPATGGFWNQSGERARAGAAKLARGETGTGGGTDAKALAQMRRYGLTEAEVLAIRTYTASDFFYINPAMVSHQQAKTPRRRKKMTDEQARDKANAGWWQDRMERTKGQEKKDQLRAEGALHAGVLLQALTKLPAVAAKTYRGMNYPAELVDRDLVEGRTITWHSFTSTSLRRMVAVGWAGGTNETVLTIRVTNGRDLRRLSVLAGEEGEILLLPGAEFKVVSVERKQKSKTARRFNVELEQTK